MDEFLDINLDEFINNSTNEINSQELITINNWNNYKNNIDNTMKTMWDFMLYNQFNNEEIIRLQNELKSNNRIIKSLTNDNNKLYENNQKIKRKLDKINKEDENIKKNKKRKINYLKIEFNNRADEIKEEYKLELNEDIKNKILLNIYASLESIKDIINLKNNSDKFYFMKDEKFLKLYNLISSLEQLDKIIGMENIKETIFKSICYFIHGINNNEELNHVMICGPPGVGKTTIAQIIGKIYLELGFLDNDKFKVASRSDLIAKYLGQTAIKTQEVIDSVIGGVLFIDEVYSLGNEEKGDSFAKECIDTINLNMTRKEPWLLIVGGYKEDIYNSFMCYNKGLERRFTVKLEINNYTSKELFKILEKFINEDNFKLMKDAITISDIENNKNNFKFFGSDMRKLYQKAKEFYSLRLMKESIKLNNNIKILTRDDFIKSLEYFKDNNENNKYNFSMYS